MISLSRIDNEIKSTRSFTELVEIVTGLLPDLPDAVRVRVVVDADIEVPEDVVEHLLVLGADAQARDGCRAAVADRALLHHSLSHRARSPPSLCSITSKDPDSDMDPNCDPDTDLDSLCSRGVVGGRDGVPPLFSTGGTRPPPHPHFLD